MATLNVTTEQLTRIKKAVELVQPHFPDLKLSQANVVNMAITELESKYSTK